MSVISCGIEGGPRVVWGQCRSAVPTGKPNESLGVVQLEKAHNEIYVCHQRMCGNYKLETNPPKASEKS